MTGGQFGVPVGQSMGGQDASELGLHRGRLRVYGAIGPQPGELQHDMPEKRRIVTEIATPEAVRVLQ